MPIDADPGNVEETAIPVSYVTERLRCCGAENVLLLLDACRNEGARDGQGVGAERQAGVVTLSSCSPNERSYEIAELQHGAFTYSLLEGLRLQGETNCATVERLDQHLRFRVPELCGKYRKPRQTPYAHAEPIEKRHLILLPRLASLSDLHPIKLDALQAETNGDLETAEQLWWRVIAVSPVDPQAHDAIKRIALKQSASPAATAAAATPAARSGGPHWGLPAPPIRLTRWRILGMAGLAAAATGAAITAPSILRLLYKPRWERSRSMSPRSTAREHATRRKGTPPRRSPNRLAPPAGWRWFRFRQAASRWARRPMNRKGNRPKVRSTTSRSRHSS
jgi:hypothetical protein